MKDTIIVDGVKYVRVEEEPKQDQFDITPGDLYYWIGFNGEVRQDIARIPDPAIAVANACKDKALMEQRALHEILDRLLWRASVEAGELDNPWDGFHKHYTITHASGCDDAEIVFRWTRKCGCVYFPSDASAQAAIDNIIKPFVAEHPDFVW